MEGVKSLDTLPEMLRLIEALTSNDVCPLAGAGVSRAVVRNLMADARAVQLSWTRVCEAAGVNRQTLYRSPAALTLAHAIDLARVIDCFQFGPERRPSALLLSPRETTIYPVP